MKKLLLTICFATLATLFSATAQVVNPSPTQGNPKDNVPDKEIPSTVTSDTSPLTEGAIMIDSTLTIDNDSLKKNSGNATIKKEGMHNQKTKEERKQKTMRKKKVE
jgi:hypothetical protein